MPSTEETFGFVDGFRRATRHPAGMPPEAFVYLVRCADGTLYCGWTIDLAARVAAHNEGRASRYTRSRRPVELAWSAALPDRSAARREEARIKQLPRAAKLALVGEWPSRRLARPGGMTPP
jgi:putative endonuclease